MQIADGLEMLETKAEMMGRKLVVHPVLIWDNDEVILVDSCYPGQLPQIRAEVEKAGVPFTRLNKLILTHHDIDHIGGVAGIQNEVPGVEILSHVDEKPYIEGEKRAHKLEQMEADLESLPAERKAIYERFKAFFDNSSIKVDKSLADGEELPCCGGIKVIHTPGHTMGHMCLYFTQSKVLIAGDALAVEAGRLVRPADSINFDLSLTRKSLQKLTDYDIEAVVCYHGGFYKGNVNEIIAELAAVN